MISKEFLLIECANLRSVLDETLGYNFGLEGTKEFYKEIKIRIDFVEDRLKNIPATDVINLQPYPKQLIQISTLISRIERSRLGEYFWPFVTEFKKIAAAIWAQNERIDKPTDLTSLESVDQSRILSKSDDSSPPLMFVLSEGGLASYAIGIEVKKASTSRHQILTILFPRTLKHFVLLHPILGHELGHALYQVSKFSPQLNQIIDTLIASSEKLCTPDATLEWLFDDDAPNPYKLSLTAHCRANNLVKGNFLQSIKLSSWKEEILCDLIGLLIFGPSYLAAHITLIYSLDTSGFLIKPKHPIAGSRINLMLTAAKLLKYDKIKLSKEYGSTASNFWKHMQSNRKTEPWYDLFAEEDLTIALDSLKKLLGSNELALYSNPSSKLIEPLVKQLTRLIPPVGYKVDMKKHTQCFQVDFRHILYAGWLALEHQLPDEEDATKTKKIDFEILNRLCEHGIMQQIAIALE